MAHPPLTSDQNDFQTERFLRTNGPPDGAFKPDVPEYALDGASKRDKYVLEMISICAKQNQWQIEQIVGLKGAHRTIHERLDDGDMRFKNIDATLDVFTKMRDNFLTRRKMVRNIFLGMLTLFLLPFLSLFAVELLKKLLKW